MELHSIWNLQEISQVPQVYPAPGFEEDGLTPVFFENMPYSGKETRVFAWYGFPEGASAEHPVPGIVLVHGGGATALADWCRFWTAKGYAVIAMDNCGGIPAWSSCPYYRPRWPRHEYSGPAGWGNIEKSMDDPADQWIYHAVCSVLRSKALLASFPQVQQDNIGINGISWGAVLSCIAIGLDNTWHFAVSVYGCGGFNTLQSNICKESDSPENLQRWFELWDPDHYLAGTSVPLLFLVGTNDISFPLDKWFNSTALPKGKVYRSLLPAYPHDHVISWKSITLNDFADTFSGGGILPEIDRIEVDCRSISAEFTSGDRKIISAELYFTRASGAWMDRLWHKIPAEIDSGKVTAQLPPLATACYLGITDEKGSVWTSRMLEF